jgi:uncharacterized protein involved in response to NO
MARCHRSLSSPHDPDLSRLLVVYVATGLGFMLLPGTFVGVLNLLKISAAHTSGAADAGWIQAHGHAQIFGWLGTFILGIGYYAIPRLRLSAFSHCAAWTTYALWTTGVALRWAVGTWPPAQWRVLFPLAGVLELIAVVIFAVSVFVARPRRHDDTWRSSVLIITAAGVAMVVAVALNAWESFRVDAPLFPASFNQRYLALITWGFVVPFIWGFSTRWLPPLLGLRPTRKQLLLPALVLLFAGVVFNPLLVPAAILFVIALRLFEPAAKEAKLRGVHLWTPIFIRLAYAWSIVAAVLAIAVTRVPGASRHAVTVGFFAAAVFTIGPRVLPAFFNVRRLWSPRLMAGSLVLLNIGCTMRVVSQILAYQHISTTAWQTLTLSAIVEMTAVTLFAANMLMTLTTGSPLQAFLEAKEA